MRVFLRLRFLPYRVAKPEKILHDSRKPAIGRLKPKGPPYEGARAEKSGLVELRSTFMLQSANLQSRAALDWTS